VPRFSPVVGIGTPPPPHPQASVPPPPCFWPEGKHSLASEGLGESQFRRGDIHCGTLYIYVLCVFNSHMCSICFFRNRTDCASGSASGPREIWIPSCTFSFLSFYNNCNLFWTVVYSTLLSQAFENDIAVWLLASPLQVTKE
jgi:hypothetical protein